MDPTRKISTSVFVGMSVDGFIARVRGEVDFLESTEPVDSDLGFGDFLASVDALVMGRTTFDTVIGFGSAWPYGDLPVVVLTHRDLEIPPHLVDVVEVCRPNRTRCWSGWLHAAQTMSTSMVAGPCRAFCEQDSSTI